MFFQVRVRNLTPFLFTPLPSFGTKHLQGLWETNARSRVIYNQLFFEKFHARECALGLKNENTRTVFYLFSGENFKNNTTGDRADFV